MSLLSTEVEINLWSRNIKRYENLGYEIPRYTNKYGKLVVKPNTKILVQVKDLPHGSNVNVDVDCDLCKKKYVLDFYDYNKCLHDGKNYCSNCAAKVLLSGENHYLWNPNKTEEERILGRQTINGYVDFVKNVLKRDNYTCQCCNKTSNNLQVHHLNGYDWFIDGRTDINNGISLCENCHKNFHTIYGRGNNTKEQFEEWIGFTVNLVDNCNEVLDVSRKVYCIENDTIYNSIFEFCKMNNIKNYAYAYLLCNDKPFVNKSNKSKIIPRSIHGLHILWYDRYVNMTKNDIEEYLNNHKGLTRRKIVCLNDKKIFNSISEASKYYNVSRQTIADCCNGNKEYHKKINGMLLSWKYFDILDDKNIS